MDAKSASEELPALYRAVLDRIAQIDAAGQRSLGYRIRLKATRIYSRAWDDRARRGLEDLLREAAGPETTQTATIRQTGQRNARVA